MAAIFVFVDLKLSFVLSSLIGAAILGGSVWFLFIHKRIKKAVSRISRQTTKAVAAFLGIKIGEYMMLALVVLAEEFNIGVGLNRLIDHADVLLVVHLRFALGILLPFAAYFFRFNYPNRFRVLAPKNSQVYFLSIFVLILAGELLSAYLFHQFQIVL